MKKVSLFFFFGAWAIWKQSLFFSLSPHIHSAATFCLKATLSQEHSLRPLLSDERGENRNTERKRERECVCGGASAIKAQFYKRSEAIEPTADSSVRTLEQNDTR